MIRSMRRFKQALPLDACKEVLKTADEASFLSSVMTAIPMAFPSTTSMMKKKMPSISMVPKKVIRLTP